MSDPKVVNVASKDHYRCDLLGAMGEFKPGQTVWHKHHREVVMNVIAHAGNALWLHDNDNTEVAHLYHADDFTATDPNQPAEPEPQSCPFCGSEPRIHMDECYISCACGLEIPRRDTRLEAIQAWNRISLKE